MSTFPAWVVREDPANPKRRRAALEEIDEEVRRPGGTGRIRGKLNELWALVGAVTAARERDRRPGGVEWTVVDEDGLAQITQVSAARFEETVVCEGWWLIV